MQRVGIGRLVVVVAVLVGAASGSSAMAGGPAGGSTTGNLQLAQRLLNRDPGARMGGDTIVGTSTGDTLRGVRDRPNFVLAVGARETIIGGGHNDELGATGDQDTIVAGHDHELIEGGADGTIVGSGAGHDLLIDRKNNATILVQSPNDEIVVSGYHDRVLCSPHITDVIYKGPSDSVSPTCRADKDPVHPVAGTGHALHAMLAHPAARTLFGDGTNDNPYLEYCPSYTDTLCTVTFPARTLSGLWANEYVPAYKCPSPQPYLTNYDFAPHGTTIPKGVQIQGLGPIGVSILTTLEKDGLAQGTATGFPHSSATNWTIGDASYTVILHCTKL